VSDLKPSFVPGIGAVARQLVADRATIRLVIVHPNRLVREAIAFVLSRHAGIVAAANVGTAGELIDRPDLPQPDVYVIDLGGSGGRADGPPEPGEVPVPAAAPHLSGDIPLDRRTKQARPSLGSSFPFGTAG